MSDTKMFVEVCEKNLNLLQEDPNLTFYKSLPLCILDAVFSIGVHYSSVINVEKNYIDFFKLSISRSSEENEHTVADFLKNIDTCTSIEEFASKVLHNSQRTSSQNGILKAEACRLVAEIFKKHNINTLRNFRNCSDKEALDRDILAVPGQGSGIMLKYLYMLAGDSDTCKPDRHVTNFIKGVCPDIISHEEIQELMVSAVETLKEKYPLMTVRLLDFAIWAYQRDK